MPKKVKTSKLMPYPPCQDERVGCKVSWYTYVNEADAKEASRAAEHNARILEAQGYDFGYQAPGHVSKQPDGRFEVTIP